jgi:uncharacterized protein (DUF362 family)
MQSAGLGIRGYGLEGTDLKFRGFQAYHIRKGGGTALKRKVSIARVREGRIEEAVRQAVELAGGMDRLIRPDTRVLVKPNLCKPAPSGSGLITHCRVTEAVTRMVLEMGPKSVVIGEGAGAGYDFSGAHSTEEAFRVSGTAEVARGMGVEIRNLNRDAHEQVRIDKAFRMRKVKISRTALESDVIISVPVMKTHNRTLMTLGLKNMKGVLPGEEKRKTHRLGLDQGIADLNRVVKPHFTVIDGVVAMEGWWEYPHDSVKMETIVAGADVVAVDAVGAYIMDFNPEQQGLSTELDSIDVVGESIEEIRRSFKPAFEVFKQRYPGVSVVLGQSACTGCVCELISALSHVREAGFLENMDGLSVVVGDPNEEDVPSEKVVLMGKCAKELSKIGRYVKGCPPKEDDMIRAICRICRVDADEVLVSKDRVRQKVWDATKGNLER